MPGRSGHTETEASLSNGWGTETRFPSALDSAPLRSTCCGQTDRPQTARESPSPSFGFYASSVNCGSSVLLCLSTPALLSQASSYSCKPLWGRLLSAWALKPGRSKSGLSLSPPIFPQTNLLTTSHRCPASLYVAESSCHWFPLPEILLFLYVGLKRSWVP